MMDSIIVPLQIMVWEGLEMFMCGVMIGPVDDYGHEYEPVFMLIDPSDAHFRPHMFPCPMCSITDTFHVHVAIDHFTYVRPDVWVSNPPTGSPPYRQNAHSWSQRMLN